MGERMGRGSHSLPGITDRSRKYARRVFLETVSDVVPEVLDALIEDVLPVFARHIDVVDRVVARFAAPSSSGSAFSVLLATSPPGYFGEPWNSFSPAREALNEWATKWNLKDDWIRISAAETLGVWIWGRVLEPSSDEQLEEAFEQFRRNPRFIYYYMNRSSAFGPGEANFQFTYPAWDLDIQPRGDYRDAVTKAFNVKLTTHLNHLETVADERQWVPIPTKEGRRNPRRHFVWLAKYQIKEWTFSRLAEAYHTSRQNVSRDIKDLAGWIGLTLRPPSKGGRPFG